MPTTEPVAYEREIPDVLRAMAGVHQTMDKHGLDPRLHHLVQLRASQINHCGYCVDMHTKEVRRDGETDERLDRLVVWDHADGFSDRERAALAWTEALTVLGPDDDLGELRKNLRAHFTEKEIGVLTAAIAAINFWNRINVSRH